MTHIDNMLKRPILRLWDQSVSGLGQSALESFAADDTLCHLVGQEMIPPTIRTWSHNRTVVLGIQDHRLPHVEDALYVVQQAGYKPIVRNSGGLAVVLDPGVLNISIVLSEKETAIDIPSGYEVMVQFVKDIFPEVAEEIEAYEIVGSYCPGSYDLSIKGKKFAGISQRRLRDGIAVQVYLCIEGSGAERAELIRDFYKAGLQGQVTKFQYPSIRPEVMASLSELTETEMTVQQVVIRIQNYLLNIVDDLRLQSLQPEEMELYSFYLKRVVERNAKMLSKE